MTATPWNKHPLEIVSARPDRRTEALLLASGGLSPVSQAARVEALMRDAERGPVRFDGLFAALRNDRMVGAVFAQPQAGRSAVVWPPVVMPGEPQETRRELLRHVCDWVRANDGRLATLLYDDPPEDDAPLLTECGFHCLATIAYLVCEQRDFPKTRPETPFECEEVLPHHMDRWTKVLRATYEETLDCPGLEDMRPAEDVVAGYRASGAVRPDFWNIFRHEGRDIGCLILVDHADQQMGELAYMGLAPSARGNGWGKKIALFAQWLTRLAGRERLLVGVDVANPPAHDAYLACGFQEWDRKVVYVQHLA